MKILSYIADGYYSVKTDNVRIVNNGSYLFYGNKIDGRTAADYISQPNGGMDFIDYDLNYKYNYNVVLREYFPESLERIEEVLNNFDIEYSVKHKEIYCRSVNGQTVNVLGAVLRSTLCDVTVL